MKQNTNTQDFEQLESYMRQEWNNTSPLKFQ